MSICWKLWLPIVSIFDVINQILSVTYMYKRTRWWLKWNPGVNKSQLYTCIIIHTAYQVNKGTYLRWLMCNLERHNRSFSEQDIFCVVTLLNWSFTLWTLYSSIFIILKCSYMKLMNPLMLYFNVKMKVGSFWYLQDWHSTGSVIWEKVLVNGLLLNLCEKLLKLMFIPHKWKWTLQG